MLFICHFSCHHCLIVITTVHWTAPSIPTQIKVLLTCPKLLPTCSLTYSPHWCSHIPVKYKKTDPLSNPKLLNPTKFTRIFPNPTASRVIPVNVWLSELQPFTCSTSYPLQTCLLLSCFNLLMFTKLLLNPFHPYIANTLLVPKYSKLIKPSIKMPPHLHLLWAADWIKVPQLLQLCIPT